MRAPSEKHFDRALETAFKESPEFCHRFLSKTKFKDEDAAYVWSQSDSPWGRTDLQVINAQTGRAERLVREGETDILVVFQTQKDRRVALHIENKLVKGSFTRLQPDLSRARAMKWCGNPKFGNYQNWGIVLVAPRIFLDKHALEAAKFDHCVTHEEIALLVPSFGQMG